MLLFDAHLDLSMNALEWNRDLTRPVADLRRLEAELTDKKDRGAGTVSLPEMRRGQVGLCVATLIGRYNEPGTRPPGWPNNLFAGWQSPEIAWAQTQGQLSWYRAMEEAGELEQIVDTATLDAQLARWQNGAADDAPIGYVLSLEGADSIRTPAHLEPAWQQGLRAIGPAHYGPGRYAQGTHAEGGLTTDGHELLSEMQRLGFILDVTHLCDESFWEALNLFGGRVWASHSNSRASVPGVRQFSDEQLGALIERDAVIGTVLDAWMLMPGWVRGESKPDQMGLTLEHVVNQIDHVCQLAGNARHAGIGSDLDGGFGREQCPADVDTIADLARLPDFLETRGYSAADTEAIMHGNWIRVLRETWSSRQ